MDRSELTKIQHRTLTTEFSQNQLITFYFRNFTGDSLNTNISVHIKSCHICTKIFSELTPDDFDYLINTAVSLLFINQDISASIRTLKVFKFFKEKELLKQEKLKI